MPTPPLASAANAISLADKTALQTAAFNQFVSQATYAIANATAQGNYWVCLHLFQYCNAIDLQKYFVSLGYQVCFPNELNPNLSPWNPAELFGWFYNEYWDYGGLFPFVCHPTRMRISWKHPIP